ncbi:beta-L-arabinofuranosidase domain-containing protein [Microbacterium indicum]|uniref:beta-L-arabinofuranosidase domain-containing protein n=1 Tax=Microbacterium indicum TaxID=358100 RepID=UPI0004102D3B|nr:beta-L-arabinofuranosidase domain-containing protein [Microbacterium indicum]
MTTATPVRPPLEPFEQGAVRLGEGSAFLRAREAMLELARAYPVDRLLAVFRANAGLDTFGAEPPGAWEGFGHPQEEAWGEADYPGAERAQTANLLRGHYAGHFLSMLAIAAAAEDDEALRAKVAAMVDGLGEVQAALAATGRFSHPGFLAAYGEWQFARLEEYAPYGEIWAPYYTCHKIMAGLLDAHELTGSERALEIVTAMGAWVAHRLSRLDGARIQRMWSLYIAGEYGGMNETLARLSRVTGDARLLEVARLFDQEPLIEAGVRGDDILTDMHANQHLPQLVGYVREYELTGERRYLDAVVGLWDMIVPGRVYAHGGTGESELWGPPDTVAGDIGRRNAETCATYNLLKIARLLFQHTRDPKYMAYYENAALNHILASRRDVRSLESPEVTYMFPVDPGALPEFDNTGTCCGGTGLENHVTNHDTVFFRDASGAPELWVNLLTPARLAWDAQGVDVRIEGGVPGGRARLTVVPHGAEARELSVRVRIPSWVRGSALLTVGGDRISGEPGSYVEIRRAWARGDVLEIDAPASLVADGAIDDAGLQAVRLGPSLLVARSDATTALDVPLSARRALGGRIVADAEGDEGGARIGGVAYEPIWTGGDRRYHMYVRDRSRTIGFAGAETGVALRERPDGSSLVSDVWRAPEPGSRDAFLDRVLAAVLAAREDGLLARDELDVVLAAAARADVDGSGRAWGSRVETGDDAGWRHEGDVVAWAIPRALAETPVPPAVVIETERPPAASGWHTASPVVRVSAVDLGAPGATDPAIDVRVVRGSEAGDWGPYRAPFSVAGEGAVRVEARAVTAGGRTGSAALDLSIDTDPPRAEARVRILGSSAEIDLRADDSVSGLERIQWGGEDTFWATYQEAFVRSLGDAEQVLEFSATDRAGNESARQRVVLPAR